MGAQLELKKPLVMFEKKTLGVLPSNSGSFFANITAKIWELIELFGFFA
jgi:hypothetical protein